MPRYLIARMRLPIGSCPIVVPHGPHSGDKNDTDGSLWKETTGVTLKLRRKGEFVIVLTDSNSHVHSVESDEASHAEHFRQFAEKLDLALNIGEEPLPTFCWDDTHFVQDDYILTSDSLAVVPGSTRIPEWAHHAEAGYHEPLLMDIILTPVPPQMYASKRKPRFDRAKLQLPEVQQCIRKGLAQISTPPAYIEQTTRGFLVARAVRSVVEEVAPCELKPRKQHWVSDRSCKLI